MFTEFFSTTNWQIIIYTLAALYAFYIMSQKTGRFLMGSRRATYGIILVLFAWIYIGTRPIWCYADSWLYTLEYKLVQTGYWKSFTENSSEWFWNSLRNVCVKIMPPTDWLLIITTFYVGGMAFAAWRWMRRHFTLAIFFLFTAFSFWGYATNGLRNGMATSLAMMAISLVTPENKKNLAKLIPSIILMILAISTHTSVYLIAAVAIVAFLIPSRKTAFYIWGFCLLLSPISTHIFSSFASGFIEDRRFANYASYDVSEKTFSRIGWRWDFIIYSAMPVILGWLVIFKKRLYDWTYIFVLSIYLYANSFWLLINSVAYSNRFAYISWFLYPIVLLMPFVKFKIWPKQSVYTGLILLASIAFSLIF